MSNDPAPRHYTVNLALAQATAFGRVTTAELAAALRARRADLPAVADARERRRLERFVRYLLDELVKLGVFARRDHVGRNGAHEYVYPHT